MAKTCPKCGANRVLLRHCDFKDWFCTACKYEWEEEEDFRFIPQCLQDSQGKPVIKKVHSNHGNWLVWFVTPTLWDTRYFHFKKDAELFVESLNRGDSTNG